MADEVEDVRVVAERAAAEFANGEILLSRGAEIGTSGKLILNANGFMLIKIR